MSDVAVAWAKAQECVDDKGRKDRNAKQTLVHLASYADALGQGWASVPVLALEMDVSERSVQRGLRACEAMGLIRRTGEIKRFDQRLYPIYQLDLERGHASTARRLKALRSASEAAAPGDTPVTPWGDAVSPQDGSRGDAVSPGDVAFVTPWGDARVTQIGKEKGKGVNPSCVRACEAAQRLWAGKAPERVAPERVIVAWQEAVGATGVEPERLLASVRACVARDPDFARGRAMNLDRWLVERRFQAWLPDDGAMPVTPPVGWCGPDEVRSAVLAAMGPGAVKSYLDTASWDDAGRAVLTKTRFAAERLRDGVGSALRTLGVSIRVEA